MGYGDFKDLPRRTASDKALHNKAFNIAKNPKYDRYQRSLASIVHKLFDSKRTSKRATQNLKNKKVNIWCADLADMELKSKFNKKFRFLSCAIGIYSTYAWVVPLRKTCYNY